MNVFISHSAHTALWFVCLATQRRLNNRINHIHERGFRIENEDNTSILEKLPNMNNAVSIHYCNIQLVAVKM